MPGIKDYVSVSKNVHKQKRLILCNLKELYATFCEKYPELKIGFSKFCSLRPKWCVPVSSKGTHSVCVHPTSKCNPSGWCCQQQWNIQNIDWQNSVQHGEQNVHVASLWTMSWVSSTRRLFACTVWWGTWWWSPMPIMEVYRHDGSYHGVNDEIWMDSRNYKSFGWPYKAFIHS